MTGCQVGCGTEISPGFLLILPPPPNRIYRGIYIYIYIYSIYIPPYIYIIVLIAQSLPIPITIRNVYPGPINMMSDGQWNVPSSILMFVCVKKTNKHTHTKTPSFDFNWYQSK